MPTELLQDRAALYVAGAMAEEEREAFEVLIERDGDLQALVASLRESSTVALLTTVPAAGAPPGDLRARVLAATDLPQENGDAMVVTDATGRVEWVNEAFTAMCGYTTEELRGRKPGALLQGPATDPAAVAKLREAQRAARPCRVELDNYHKDGTRYRAAIRMYPFLDDDGRPLHYVAREQVV